MTTYRTTTHREPGEHLGDVIVRFLVRDNSKAWFWGTAVWTRGFLLEVDRWERVEEYE